MFFLIFIWGVICFLTGRGTGVAAERNSWYDALDILSAHDKEESAADMMWALDKVENSNDNL